MNPVPDLIEDMQFSEDWADDDFGMDEDDDMLLLSAAESVETAVKGKLIQATKEDVTRHQVARVVPITVNQGATNRKTPKKEIQTSIDSFLKPKKARMETFQPDFELEDDLELFNDVPEMPPEPAVISADPFVYLSEVKKKTKENPDKRIHVTVKVFDFDFVI